jgi:subtilisin family serine protease
MNIRWKNLASCLAVANDIRTRGLVLAQTTDQGNTWLSSKAERQDALKHSMIDRMFEYSSVNKKGSTAKTSKLVMIEGSETSMFFCKDDACKAKIKKQQDDIISEIQALHPNARVVAQVQKLTNVVFMDLGDITASNKIKKISGITRIQNHQMYRTLLNATVEYIQGNVAHEKYCATGKGIRIAILDDGIDYTHEAIGGPGTVEAYEQAYGKYDWSKRNTERNGLFPTETVIDGIDFLGDSFNIINGTMYYANEDSDPIDAKEGHGTFVASNILAVAPDAKLLVAKVCSQVDCPDFAVLQGMEYAMDPNGDGNSDDRVDIINLSLGSPVYSSYYDMLAFAIERAFQLGTLTVAAFGNEGDLPFISGAQANSPNVLAVGATGHPDFLVEGRQYMEDYSSRGPGSQFQLKPDISAPSGSFAAIAGSGNKYMRVHGTSFSAPITVGAAALVMERCPGCSPFAIKAILMNNADRNVGDEKARNSTSNKQAPLSSVGSGEIRIAAALAADFWAFSPDEGDIQPSISLGLINVADDMVVARRIRVLSLTSGTDTIVVSVIFRDPADEAMGALEVNIVNTTFTLSSCSANHTEIEIQFKITAVNVPDNFLGSRRSPENLDMNEFDGHVVLMSMTTSKSIHIPFYAILRKAANVTVVQRTLPNGGKPYETNVSIENTGAGVAQIDAYQLLGRAPDTPEADYGEAEPSANIRAIGYRTVLANKTNCSYVAEFVINLWERPRHVIPTIFLLYSSFYSETSPLSDLYSAPRGILESVEVFVSKNEEERPSCAGFEVTHSPGSANIIFRACGEQLGLRENHVFFGYFATVGIDDYEITEFFGPFAMKYPQPEISAHSYDVRPGETLDTVKVTNRNNDASNPSKGIILVTNAYRTANSTGAVVKEQEAIILLGEGLKESYEITVDKLVFPQAKEKHGPLCEWNQEYLCSFPTPVLGAPLTASTPPFILTEYPTVTPAPSSQNIATSSEPSCTVHEVPRQSVPTIGPSVRRSDTSDSTGSPSIAPLIISPASDYPEPQPISALIALIPSGLPSASPTNQPSLTAKPSPGDASSSAYRRFCSITLALTLLFLN